MFEQKKNIIQNSSIGGAGAARAEPSNRLRNTGLSDNCLPISYCSTVSQLSRLVPSKKFFPQKCLKWRKQSTHFCILCSIGVYMLLL